MARTVTLTGVANTDIPDVTSEYEHEGATVTVTSDGPETSTLVAVWPAAGPEAAATGAVQAHISAAQAHSAAATAHAAAATAIAALGAVTMSPE